ncbi:MAG: hypothetical protein JNM53_16605 [Gemmatimonadetes bacterium]|nr:hypothetical protein [Gemmatimonadota bacterium]
MSPCALLSDRMVLVADGTADWSAAEAEHLASCPDCREEWRLIQGARRLGTEAARRTDAGRVSRLVLATLAGERRRRRWVRVGGLVGIAAAAALAIMVSTADRRGSGGEAGSIAVVGAEGLQLRLAELESLNEAELEAILDGLDVPLSEGAGGAPPALGDLDDTQLERVLRSLEG